MTCDAAHDGHDCAERGACTRAMTAMCERVTNRDRGERGRPIDHAVTMTVTPEEWRNR